MFKRHVERCQTDRTEKVGDDIDAELFISHKLVYKQNEKDVYNRHCMNLGIGYISLNYETDCREVRRGWARQPKWGNHFEETRCMSSGQTLSYGLTLAQQNQGNISPVRMLKQLQTMHPGRYDFPTKNQIRKVVSKLTTDGKHEEERCLCMYGKW